MTNIATSIEKAYSTRWLKENMEAIIVAFIAAMVIRCFSIEVFQIPTGSMEPTLMGGHELYDSKGNKIGVINDRIMATKFFYELSPIERFDVVLFKFPLNQSKNFIKRVVGLPEEELYVKNGNIFTRKINSTEQQFQIAKKPLRVQESIWINPTDIYNFTESRDTFEKYWDYNNTTFNVEDSRLAVKEISGSRSARFTYKKSITDGHTSDKVGDIKLSLNVEILGNSGYVFSEIENEYGSFTVYLSKSSNNKLLYIDNDGKRVEIPLKTEKVKLDRAYRLELLVYDGTVYTKLNGTTEAKYDFLTFDKPFNQLNNYSVSFGSNELLFMAQNIRIARDIYYKAKENVSDNAAEAITIPPHCYIMMGDNVNTSHDSRGWRKRTFILKDDREIECEEGEVDTSGTVKDPSGISHDYAIKNNIHGVAYWFDEKAIKTQIRSESSPFVEEKYILGKAFWIWWPPSRAFRLIR